MNEEISVKVESSPSIIRDDGQKEWRNEAGLLHREDGPAVECTDGTKEYYRNGELHREDGPAIEYADGTKSYALYGAEFDRKTFIQEQKFLKVMDNHDNREATKIEEDGTKRWHNEKGELHREDGPALIDRAHGCIEYYRNGKMHREDGPAFITAGRNAYYLNGEEASRAAVENLKKTHDFMERPIPQGKGAARDYCEAAREVIKQEGQWPGKSADENIAKKLLQQGHDKSKIIEAVRGKSPEMLGKDLNESRAYAKALVDRALTPEVKKERQRGVSRDR